MTRLIPTFLLVGLFAFASSAALANGEKNGFTTTPTSTQGGSTKDCNNTSGCTTTTTTVNGGGNNPQPSTCDGPAGQCK